MFNLPHRVRRPAHDSRGTVALRSRQHGLQHGTTGKRARSIVNRYEPDRRPHSGERQANRILACRTPHYRSYGAALESYIRKHAFEQFGRIRWYRDNNLGQPAGSAEPVDRSRQQGSPCDIRHSFRHGETEPLPRPGCRYEKCYAHVSNLAVEDCI